MGNEIPKEYLTLPSGQANNYVNISHAETKCKRDEDSGNFLSFICLRLRREPHIDFRSQCVIMTLTGWGLLLMTF